MSELLYSRKIATLALAIGIGAAACGGEEKDSAQATQPQTEAAQPADTAIEQEELPTLVFDDLGTPPHFIRVYPGVSEAAEDKKHNGTYPDGEGVLAECKTGGRTVNSDVAAGEPARSSDEWIRIHGSPGEIQYATAVYIENPDQVLSQLEDC